MAVVRYIYGIYIYIYMHTSFENKKCVASRALTPGKLFSSFFLRPQLLNSKRMYFLVALSYSKTGEKGREAEIGGGGVTSNKTVINTLVVGCCRWLHHLGWGLPSFLVLVF